MAVHHLNAKTDDIHHWRVAKKITPSQRGAIKLARLHGKELLCVRYRENPDGTERLTTVELLVERVVIQKRDDPVVYFKLRQEEIELRYQVMAKGARYDGKRYLWKLRRSEVLRMGLRERIVAINDPTLQEQVHP